MEKHPKVHEEDNDSSTPLETTNITVNSNRRDLFLPIAILAAALMVGGAIVFATLYKGGIGSLGNTPAGGNATSTNPAAVASTTNTSVMVLGPRDAILGNASATVTLIEYGDYQCPYCAEFFNDTESQIVQNYVNTGKVRFVFRNFAFLGDESTAAAEAAECAEDQNKLWPYHDALYTAKVGDENSGGSEDDGFYNRTEFLKLANQVGLDIPTFTTCIDTNKNANIVAQEKGDAANDGVDSTPTFFINGTMISGAQPYSVFQQALDSALQG